MAEREVLYRGACDYVAIGALEKRMRTALENEGIPRALRYALGRCLRRRFAYGHLERALAHLVASYGDDHKFRNVEHDYGIQYVPPTAWSGPWRERGSYSTRGGG